jgi:hypothetical protein
MLRYSNIMFFLVFVGLLFSCSAMPRSHSGVELSKWNSMTTLQREQYVHDLIQSGEIAFNKTTLRDLQIMFAEEAKEGYVEQGDPSIVYFTKFPPGVSSQGGVLQISREDGEPYVFFDCDASGKLRTIKFGRGRDTFHDEVITSQNAQ